MNGKVCRKRTSNCKKKQKPNRIIDFGRPREHCKSTTSPNSDYVLMRQIFSASMMGEIVGQASILTSDDASTLTKQKQLDSRQNVFCCHTTTPPQCYLLVTLPTIQCNVCQRGNINYGQPITAMNVTQSPHLQLNCCDIAGSDYRATQLLFVIDSISKKIFSSLLMKHHKVCLAT